MKIRTKLLLLILISGICCLMLFRFLWLQKWNAWAFLIDDFPVRLNIFPKPAENFMEILAEEALKYDLPKSEEDDAAAEALTPFLELADDYTALYLYGSEDGLFRAGYMPQIMNKSPFRTFFDLGYDWTEGTGEQIYVFPLQFRNGCASVHLSYYHSTCFIYPYFIFCLAACIFLFLSVILFFVSQKMKTVVCLKETILRMSSGDLATPVPCSGQDELGILSQELDRLRCTLHENFREEQQLHRSNQELIAALSHDLRTPLTILKGYLDILNLNRNPDMQTAYVRRCIQKADDIREMTDRMFEYALVFDEPHTGTEQAVLSEIPLEFFLDSLREHEDFLHLAGFQTDCQIYVPSDSGIRILANPQMLKRIFNNLFSNIIKYADKKETVSISADSSDHLTITIKNGVKTADDKTESTQIGLKSVRKIMELMDGTLTVDDGERFFTAELRFPSCLSRQQPCSY